MQLDDVIVRTLAVLQTRLPGVIDTLEAQTAATRVVLTNFVASTSGHSLTVNGTTYGPSIGATQQAVLAALSALVAAGVSSYSGYVTGTGSAAQLLVTIGPTVASATNTTAAARSYAQILGAVDAPVDYRRGTDDLPELDYPAVLVRSEGPPDVRRWVTDHDDRAWPLAVEVRGFQRDTEELSDALAWLYAEAVKRVLQGSLALGGPVDWVEIETVGPPEPWGDGAFGRSVMVRAMASQFAVAFSA